MSRVLAAISRLLVLNGSLAHATVRNFFTPEMGGQPLDSCLTGTTGCGKPAPTPSARKKATTMPCYSSVDRS